MADKKHAFTSTELKAGAMVLTAGVLLVLFMAAVSGLRPAAAHKTFVAYFEDTGGLNIGADVRFGGLKAGRIVGLAPDETNQKLIRVVCEVSEDLPVNTASRAFIGQVSLTSEKHLEITTGEQGAPPMEDGSEIATAPAGGGLFGGIDVIAQSVSTIVDDVREVIGVRQAQMAARAAGQDDADITTILDILDNVDGSLSEGKGLVTDVRTIVSERKPDIEAILARVKDIEDSAKVLVDNVNAVIEENRSSIRNTLAGAEGAMGDVRAILADVNTVTEDLESMAASLQSALENADALTGSAQEMVVLFRPALEDIVLDVRETVRYLKQFSRTISEQPQSVIRGAEPQGRQAN